MNQTEPDHTTETGLWLTPALDRQGTPAARTGTITSSDANAYAGTKDAPECGVGAGVKLSEDSGCSLAKDQAANHPADGPHGQVGPAIPPLVEATVGRTAIAGGQDGNARP